MDGVIAPTDSRYRGDVRRYESGLDDEADEEKIRCEIKQRVARKKRNDEGTTWTPNFFRLRPHPFIEDEHVWEFIQDNNYWQRRERGDWEGLPDLWN